MFERYKDLLNENNDLMSKVEHLTKEKKKLNVMMTESANLIVDLQGRLRESKLTTSNL